MQFTGLAGTILMQAGAFLGALVVVFYILKLRRRSVAVPFASLWKRVLRDKEASSFFARLKRLLSLLLQLVLLALLLFALGDPQPEVASREGRNVVLLLDASASMKATDVEQGEHAANAAVSLTRLDVAKDKVRKWLRGMGPADRMLIAQMGAVITPLTTMSSDAKALEDAVDEIRASDVRVRLSGALRFAVDALRGLPNAEIIVVSDGAGTSQDPAAAKVDLGDAELYFEGVGRSEKNVAISAFSVRRYPLDKSRYEVLIEVANTSEESNDVELELYGDRALTDIVRFSLAPKETVARFYPNLSGASRTLEAIVRLQGGKADDLPSDDYAYALLPQRRRARVQVVTAGNMYLDAALLLDEYLDVTTVSAKEYPGKGEFDVTIFDNLALPLSDNCGHVLYLNPPKSDLLPFEVGKRIKSDRRYTVGFDEVSAKHPILRHLSLSDVNIAQAHALKGKGGYKALGKSFKGNLLLSGRHRGHKFVALGFDIRDSDFPLRIAWPLFLVNVINFCLDEDVRYISSFKTGEVWHLPAGDNRKMAKLMLPDGEEQLIPVKNGRAVFLGQQAGFYRLQAGEDAGMGVMFAANMSDLIESAIKPLPTLEVGGRKAKAVQGFGVGVRQRWWLYLLFAVLLISACEWLSYHRRVTV